MKINTNNAKKKEKEEVKFKQNITSNPFFIVGCGRSGTTLLRAILNNHPEVGIPLESLFIIDYLQSKQPIKILKHHLTKEYELKEWGVPISIEKLKDCNNSFELIDRLHFLYINQQDKVIWGQKTPRFVRYGHLLKQSFPRAKFIHLIRDPRAVVSSLCESQVHQSSIYHGAMRWKYDIQAGLSLEQKTGKDLLRLHYEDLVNDTLSAIKKVCLFLDIKFSPTMLDYYLQTPSEYSSYYKKIHSKLAEPITESSLDKWRLKLSLKEIRLIEFIAEKEMVEVNYKKETTIKDRPNSFYMLFSKLSRYMRIPKQLYHYQKHRNGYLRCVLLRKLKLRTLGLLPINR